MPTSGRWSRRGGAIRCSTRSCSSCSWPPSMRFPWLLWLALGSLMRRKCLRHRGEPMAGRAEVARVCLDPGNVCSRHFRHAATILQNYQGRPRRSESHAKPVGCALEIIVLPISWRRCCCPASCGCIVESLPAPVPVPILAAFWHLFWLFTACHGIVMIVGKCWRGFVHDCVSKAVPTSWWVFELLSSSFLLSSSRPWWALRAWSLPPPPSQS